LGFRNVLINGDFRINQRAFSSTTNNGAYGFDRWRIDANGGTTTYSAQTFASGNAISGQEPTNYARIVTTGQSNTNGTYSLFRQPVEDVRTFAGQMVTVSFWAKVSSGTPKVAVELEQNFGSGGSAGVTQYAGQVTLSTSWQRFTLTTTLPSISGKTIGTNSHLLFTFILSGGPDWNTRSGSIGIQSNTFDFWGVQLEQNYQETPFEQRPIGIELQLCQRYYWKWTSVTSGDIYHQVYQPASTTFYLSLPLPTTMRTSTSNALTVSGTWNRINSAISPVSYFASKNWITIYSQVDPSISNANSSGFYSSAGSSTLEVNAEL